MFPSDCRSSEAALRYALPAAARRRGGHGLLAHDRPQSPDRRVRIGRVRIGLVAILFGIAALGGTGCATRGAAVTERRSLYLTEHPDVDSGFAEAILAGQIMIGMTPEMVSAAWGQPQRADQRKPPAQATPEQAALNARLEPEEAQRLWGVRYVYGNYLVSPRVTNLYFVGDQLKLIEYIDTKGQNSISVSDPSARIPQGGARDPSGIPGKGGTN